MFREILIPSTGEASDGIVFATARAAAGANPAHLTFLFARQQPTDAALAMSGGAMDGGFGLATLIEALEEEGAAAKTASRSAWLSFCAAGGLSTIEAPQASNISASLEVVAGDEAMRLVQHGRTSDLVVIGRPGGGQALALGRLEDVLNGVGRPILIAGPTAPETLVRLIVIAWKDTAEAARAVGAAMPFIEQAERVVVMTASEDETGADEAQASAARMVATLLRHAPLVHAQHVPAGPGHAAESLLAAATELGANMLVMGGYGHGELRESIFGGFTRTVLNGADLPVLMMR